MLSEVRETRQIEGEPHRRWFTDPDVDLYVWYDDAENVIRFQICYDKGPDEKALSWDAAAGFSHTGVDDGESGVFRMKSTPILTGSAELHLDAVRRRFAAAAGRLEHDLHEFIMHKLEGDSS